MNPLLRYFFACAALLVASLATVSAAQAQQDRFDALANLPQDHNRATPATAKTLKEELTFSRALQTYVWAMPLLNTMGMRDGFAKSYGTGYNIMAIWSKRLSAKTQITTPNSDLIYGMTFVNLAKTGPLVFVAPPKLQGILLDAWQRPIPKDGGKYFGDVGLPGPDAGKGGKFLILPPGYKGDVPTGYYVYRSGTNNVFIFLRAFYQSLDNISPPTKLLKQSVFYPLGKRGSAKPMKFVDASGKPHEMLPRTNFAAFKDLKYLIDTEGKNLAGPDWLGMLAGLGIVKDEPFDPDARTRKILSDAAKVAYRTTRVLGAQSELDGLDLRVYKDRQWVNPINNLSGRVPSSPTTVNWMRRGQGYRDLDLRAWFFTDYYSISPGMVSMTADKGAYYMIAFKDAAGNPLNGENDYTLKLPPNIPAKLFWSVTAYQAANASGVQNGQPFPSLGKLDKPTKQADGSTVLHLGPKAPASTKGNWLATVPGQGYFVILRLYLPEQPALDGSWKPGDLHKMN